MLRCALAAACAASLVGAANPIVPGIGQADPHVHYWPEVDKFVLCA
jgi:hypothetical protein